MTPIVSISENCSLLTLNYSLAIYPVPTENKGEEKKLKIIIVTAKYHRFLLLKMYVIP